MHAVIDARDLSAMKPGMVTALAPGDWVRHPGEPDWGLGQVQSVAGARVTVNFEDAGKRLINAELVFLEPVTATP